MAAKKTENVTVNNEAVEQETVNVPENTENEAAEVVETEKQDGFIKKGLKAYGKAIKEHPVKTVAKTVALPLTFGAGYFLGKKTGIASKAADIIDVAVDVVEDVVPEAVEEIVE